MNNGNILNSLLGATSTTAATSANTSTKPRVDTTEKFRSALEQARPEVAAPKPAARKAADQLSRESTGASNRATTEQRPSTSVEKATTSRRDIVKNQEGKVAERAEKTGSTDINKQDKPDPAETTSGVAVTTDPAKTQDASINTSVLGLLSGASTEPVVDTEGVDLDPLEEVDPALLFGLSAPVTDEQLVEEENPELADGALVAAVSVKGPLASGNSVSGDIRPFASALPSTLLNGNQSSAGMALVAPTPALDDSRQQFDPGLTTGGSTADNPNFLQLSGKAAFGKLMDANAANDKPVDPAKPLQTPIITEPLARLSEAQSPAARSFIVQTGIPVTVGQPQWSQAVGEKVLWLAAQNVSSAEIRLDPPDLGPMQVKVSVNQDQASVTFTSPHPMVREALDQQLNRLREMFSEQGLNLVNVDVSDKSHSHQEQDQEQAGRGGAAGDVEDEELNAVAMTPITSSRLVDHYA